jgi:hypothetical protein
MNSTSQRNRNARRRGANARSREHQSLLALKQELKSEAVMLRQGSDPPSYKATTIFSRTVRVVGGADPTLIVTPTSILTALFGTTAASAPYQLQFMSINVWGLTTQDSQDLPLLVTVLNDTTGSTGSDPTTFSDRGVFGSSRPNVHVRFSHNIRDTWLLGSSTALATISQAAKTSAGLIADVHVRILFTPTTVSF